MVRYDPRELPVLAALEALGIRFDRYQHPPLASAADAAPHSADIGAVLTKNLFLRNPKGTRHYLVIIELMKRADLRSIAQQLGDGKLSFGSPEQLMAMLGVTPGSVSPFGLVHDDARQVRVCLDRDFTTAGRISFHPNINTATLVLAFADFERFLASRGNSVQYVNV
jgi:Ala-tRNA(Pro) deacylase